MKISKGAYIPTRIVSSPPQKHFVVAPCQPTLTITTTEHKSNNIPQRWWSAWNPRKSQYARRKYNAPETTVELHTNCAFSLDLCRSAFGWTSYLLCIAHALCAPEIVVAFLMLIILLSPCRDRSSIRANINSSNDEIAKRNVYAGFKECIGQLKL